MTQALTGEPTLLSYLERYPEQGGPVERVPLTRVPFVIGRAETADLTIYSNPVSKAHATILQTGGRYVVRDLGSTNGTFVNGERVHEHVLEDGDILHLAHVEFCFRRSAVTGTAAAATGDDALSTQALPLVQPSSLIRSAKLLRELIRTEAVDIVYEPVVNLQTSDTVGYEALARGSHPQLTNRPAELLALADQCGLAVELSQLFRRLAIRRAHRLPAAAKLFLNVHAREIEDFGLIASLSDLGCSRRSSRRIVIEIAESSVTNVQMMADYRTALGELGIEFAYDDFGAGQGRLTELTDVPPAYLKLDKCLIHGIDAPARQEMVGALIAVATSLGVQVIAEGIETDEMFSVCRRLGCGLGQGYLFCRPASTQVSECR